MGLTPYAAKQMLNYLAGGATAARPTQRWLALSDDQSELTCQGYSRLTASFDAATFNSVSMLSAQTFGMTAGSVIFVRSIQVFDAASQGSELFGTTLEPAKTAQAGGAAFVVRDLGTRIE